ncbi:MAG: NHLP bacteriocin system secretion protein [SAR324 cluster bacterium]|nr:NHLP bacteriocin system secretion protein [SAR324 cluster bacterium]
MRKHIFRKVSLERLSSPEQLDQLMQITTPKGWFALIAISTLIGALLIWSVSGSIPSKVLGQGILFKPGGVFDIVAFSSGQVSDIAVTVGEHVEKGQTIARIAQPEIVEQIRIAKSRLIEWERQKNDITQFSSKDVKLQTRVMDQQRTNLENEIEISRKHLNSLEKKIQSLESLLKQGLITKQQLENTRQEYFVTEQDIKQKSSRLSQLDVQKLNLGQQKQQEFNSIEQRINEETRNIRVLEDRLILNSRVVSPYGGRILEIRVDEGSIVGMGSPVLSLERLGQEDTLNAVIFVSALEGKKVRLGMNVGISPSTVKKEEYGYMKGKVTYVSEFPSTSEGMLHVLKNRDLVQQLSSGGAPIELRVDLLPDENTISSYQWTSSKGPPTKIFSGTLCTAGITVTEQRPISLVMPFLRNFLGL